MKTKLSAAHISHDLFSVEMHGKVYVDGAVLSNTGRVTGVVDREELQAMAAVIQAALNGIAPSPGRPRPVVDDLNPEDLA